MTRILSALAAALVVISLAVPSPAAGPDVTPQAALDKLKQGNLNFAQGKATHPHQDAKRVALADGGNQGKYAYATIMSCSDSRVPPELIFDAGVMDLFVVRLAGNVVATDSAGTIEYGLAHVNTPVLVVLGHLQCGAVAAVCQAAEGHGHALERNIPPLVAPIGPAVAKTRKKHPKAQGAELVALAVEANVWQGIRDLFMQSAATRQLVKSGKVMVVGAIYEMKGGRVRWLPSDRVTKILAEVEADPGRATQVMYEK